ncbi:uncharacterized protein LOC124855584 [Girardinichthys multiradiatus]|uniref:uncharacterized protein LOC124855584 n=1 Tax=Girardinichthys multiradiatus TaxID=208333 RepID=UPI001FAC1883|nr:uncharacterized protein LOC124855584 [Girardinichthys multiradiatus]
MVHSSENFQNDSPPSSFSLGLSSFQTLLHGNPSYPARFLSVSRSPLALLSASLPSTDRKKLGHKRDIEIQTVKIVKEFTHLMSVDLYSFYEGLDGNLQKLLLLYRSRRFDGNKEMMALLDSLDRDPSNQRKRTAVLLGLPCCMKEKLFPLLKMCEPTDCEDDLIKGMLAGILLVLEDVSEPLPSSYQDVAIVLEANIVIRHLCDLPSAFMTLMGLMYVLNLNYPKDLKYTFEVIQRLFLGIGSDSCSARVHSLKNTLFK